MHFKGFITEFHFLKKYEMETCNNLSWGIRKKFFYTLAVLKYSYVTPEMQESSSRNYPSFFFTLSWKSTFSSYIASSNKFGWFIFWESVSDVCIFPRNDKPTFPLHFLTGCMLLIFYDIIKKISLPVARFLVIVSINRLFL